MMGIPISQSLTWLLFSLLLHLVQNKGQHINTRKSQNGKQSTYELVMGIYPLSKIGIHEDQRLFQ